MGLFLEVCAILQKLSLTFVIQFEHLTDLLRNFVVKSPFELHYIEDFLVNLVERQQNHLVLSPFGDFLD